MHIKNFIALGAGFLLISFLSFRIYTDEKQQAMIENSNILATQHPANGKADVVKKKDTHVLLTIDTRSINENNKNSMVIFSDDRSNPSENPGDPEQYVSLVDKNMKIYWSGQPADANSDKTIDILEVYRKPEGGAEILEKTFRDPNKDGIVIGKVKNKNVTGFENYNIVFRINGDTIQTFTIDPKLKMTDGR